MDVVWMFLICLFIFIHILYASVCRNQLVLLKITSSLGWSWRLWTERTPTWFVLPQLERSEVRRSLSCLTAGEVPLITGAPSTPETSSPSVGVHWQSIVYSHLETSVSVDLIWLLFFCMEGEICQIPVYETCTISKVLSKFVCPE